MRVSGRAFATQHGILLLTRKAATTPSLSFSFLSVLVIPRIINAFNADPPFLSDIDVDDDNDNDDNDDDDDDNNNN